ncbi:hypothetical protein F4824DRAFT_459939 [Ustulina deusta]|nr:hypothetical protein F4824DRAFT_459939 [Ustulina deusta]
MRPSSFFGVLAVAVSSLPTPQFSDPLTGNLPGALLQSVGDLLGSLLGRHGHEEPSLFPCLFSTTSCMSDCTADCIREPQACGSCLSSCFKGDTCSAKNELSYFDQEGEQEIGDDDTEVAAASRVTKASKGKTPKEAAASKTNKVAMKTKTHPSPDVPK